MRDFVISTILLSLLLIATVGNSLYINNEVKSLLEAVESIPSIDSPECPEFINSLRTEWKKFKKIARISLNYSEINKMDCLIEEIDCHFETKNNNDFEHAKVMMINLLGEIVRLEKISADGIL